METNMTDMNGETICVGDRIYAPVYGETPNHFLYFQDGTRIDLSEPVTVRIDERGILMAGQLSLASYKNRILKKL